MTSAWNAQPRFLQVSELEGALRVTVQFLHFIIENSEEHQPCYPSPLLRGSRFLPWVMPQGVTGSPHSYPLSSLASELLGKGGCQPGHGLCNGEVNELMKTRQISAKVIALTGMLCQQISPGKNLMVDDLQK